MTTKIDARGFSCPQPVILTQKGIEANKFPLEVLVDTVTARENIRRKAEKQGLKVMVHPDNDEFRIVITK